MHFTNLSFMVSMLVVGLGLAVNGYAQSFLTNGLVAYYPFNGNANDASGNGNNGIVNGANLAFDRYGSSNSCYSFNGVANYVKLPLNTGNLNGLRQVTISAWIKPDKANNNCMFSHWAGHYVAPPTPNGIMFGTDGRSRQNQLLESLASDADDVVSTTRIERFWRNYHGASSRNRLVNTRESAL